MKSLRKHEAIIGWGDPDNDPIERSLAEAVAKMENTCREVIERNLGK